MRTEKKDIKVAFYTLGCKLNFSETSAISREFRQRGYEIVDFKSIADIYIINTCSVTELADKKCRNIIRRAIRTSPNSKVIVVGCYSQLNPEEISKIAGVDLILGTEEKYEIFNYLDKKNIDGSPFIFLCPVDQVYKFHESYSLNERTRSFLKVQDGCDYKCSYCTVPLARGRSSNIAVKVLVKQAQLIADKGINEIILTGVNIGDFGKSTNESFLKLIQSLAKIKNIERFRISSIEPNLLSDEIIEFIAYSNKFAPHFHIPLQSGCNKILGLMRRKYNKELFETKVKKIKNINPYVCIGADVIVGFPGETENDFNETFSFLNSLDISYLHVFQFSERRNTSAALLSNKINSKIKSERSEKLIKMSELKREIFYQNNVKKISRVIFESQKINGQIFGFTDNYIKTETQHRIGLVNSVKKCELLGINQNKNMKIKILN